MSCNAAPAQSPARGSRASTAAPAALPRHAPQTRPAPARFIIQRHLHDGAQSRSSGARPVFGREQGHLRSISPLSTMRLTRRRHVAGDTCTRSASAWLDKLASLCSTSRMRRSMASIESADFSFILKFYFLYDFSEKNCIFRINLQTNLSSCTYDSHPTKTVKGRHLCAASLLRFSSRDIVPILVQGLQRLEYRGYDSCGVAVHTGATLVRSRSTRRV